MAHVKLIKLSVEVVVDYNMTLVVDIMFGGFYFIFRQKTYFSTSLVVEKMVGFLILDQTLLLNFLSSSITSNSYRLGENTSCTLLFL